MNESIRYMRPLQGIEVKADHSEDPFLHPLLLATTELREISLSVSEVSSPDDLCSKSAEIYQYGLVWVMVLEGLILAKGCRESEEVAFSAGRRRPHICHTLLSHWENSALFSYLRWLDKFDRFLH